VTVVPRLAAIRGTRATFTDGRGVELQSIVWATGYREDTSWLQIPEALGDQSELIHREGATPVDGLFVLGRNWQTSRGSSLLLGVATDARAIAARLATSLPNQPGALAGRHAAAV
jgi:putative flavoprotein involved in K+ transport